jgi:hypothetical protein
MKHKIHLIITLLTIIPLVLFALVSFILTIDLKDIYGTLLTLSLEQVHYLLVFVVGTILLHELSAAKIMKQIIEQELIVLAPRRSHIFFLRSFLWWVTASILAIFGFLIPFLDLLGSFPFSAATDISTLAPKIALLLLSLVYIYHAVDRPMYQRTQLKRVLSKTGAMQVLNRAEDHIFMSCALDEIKPEEIIYVTHFEEPRNPMQPNGFYYESEFMKKWYGTVSTKALKIFQIVLINSTQDIIDLERRLELTKDMPFYSIACILAPRLTIFMDFMVIPDQFALLGFSDNPTVRNMDEFSVVIKSGPAIKRFERLFAEVLLPEAIHIKTFEGVDTTALAKVKAQAQAIAKTQSKVLKEMFHFEEICDKK